MPCVVEHCSRVGILRNGLCSTHHGRAVRLGYHEARGTPDGQGYTVKFVHGRGVRGHVEVVERALGRRIGRPIEVHHVDNNRSNNKPSNLVVCPNHAYHALLHRRTKALAECGNANWMKCCYCHTYDDPKNMWVGGSNAQSARHVRCGTKYINEWKAARR